MRSLRLAVVPLRLLLVALFALLALFQFMSLPGQFAHMAEESPDVAHLRWPLTLVAGAILLCAQVVIVCTWRLLLGVFLYAGFTADDPGLPLLLALLLMAGGVLGLLMLVMRALLSQATRLRSDMEAVI
jgi:hypothetical protein